MPLYEQKNLPERFLANNTPCLAPHTLTPNRSIKKIRSYVHRGGRVSKAQQRAIDNLTSKFVVPFHNHFTQWTEIFGRQAPLKLEIGFGMGDATAHIAKTEPNTDFIAIDIHPPGIGALMNTIQKENLTNVRLVCHDAIDILTMMLPDSSLNAVHIFFPDPWPKTKHNKRRLIQENLVILLAKKICSGGYVHCATDWPSYARHILETFNANSSFIENSLPNFAKPSYRPNTKFEARGIKLGYLIQDLIFQRK